MNANDMVPLKVLAHTHGLMAAEEAYVRSGRDVATISEAGLRLLQATTGAADRDRRFQERTPRTATDGSLV